MGAYPWGSFLGGNHTGQSRCKRPIEREKAPNRTKNPYRIQTSDAINIGGLAVCLARKRRLTDAAFYFLASVFSFSKEPMDLHPRYGIETMERANNPMHRVWEAQSLFAAFRAIEALTLTVVGASGVKPSVLGKVWNKEIRENLEDRLRRVGIAPGDTFLWHSRGRSTGVQRKLRARTSASSPAPWAGGSIRDAKIPYVDAINHAQWLRSMPPIKRKSAYRGFTRLTRLTSNTWPAC
jgi:hypothetical protein